jgi:hypothetical protein
VAGAFLTIGTVQVHSLGGDRYRVTAPDHDEEIDGFDEARAAAHAVAEGRT